MSRWMGPLSVLALVAFLVATLVSCSSSAPAAPTTIKIGAVVPLTGRYASGGTQVQAGYQFAVDDINKAGGIYVKEYGKSIPLEMKLLDDESDPAKTASLLETLNSSDKVSAYLGGFASDMHAAGAAIAEKNKVPYLGIAFALWSIHQQGYKYLFSPFNKSPDIAFGTFDILNSMPKDQRPTTFAIFQEKTDWGVEMTSQWKRNAAAMGYNIALVAEYAPGAKDFSDIILKAKSAGVDAVLALPSPPDGIAIVKQMKELGLSPKYTFFVRAPDGVNWTEGLGKDGDFVMLAPGWHYGVNYPLVKELNAEHQAKFGRPADVIVGPAYSCVQILAEAIKKAGKLDREAIRNAIADINTMTVAGPVTFRPDGTGNVPFFAVQWQNGKQELVWPKEMATKPLMYPAKPSSER